MNEFSKFKEQASQQDMNKEGMPVSKIPIVEERLNIGVRRVETGTVQLSKRVISEEVSQEVPVTCEEVRVEHVAINQYVEVAPEAVRYEGNTTIISVVKEVLVVEKRLMLVEELHISKTQVTSTSTVKEFLRKEEIEISRAETNNTATQDLINNK